MHSLWMLALAALGCRGVLGIQQPIDALDAPLDDQPDPCTLWHPEGFEPCALGTPLPAIDLGAGQYLYDTTTAGGKLSETRLDNTLRQIAESALTVMQSDGSTVAVLSVDALTVGAGATLRVVGAKPLLVVAWSTIRVDGAIDAGSHIGVAQLGAGANHTACGSATGLRGNDAPATGGSGGGGGGGHQGVGGPGGASETPAGGAGGSALVVPVIRGGCPGGNSGVAGAIAESPADDSTSTPGGAGGGALRLVAHDAIEVAGSVSASGAGGAGALQNSVCGGGGGGSGGYVALDAPSVKVSGAIAANGGGGGGGAGRGDQGRPGSDGRLDLQPAAGGGASIGGCGRPGGDGAVQATVDGKPGLAFVQGPPPCDRAAGGGGGGGASGFIVVASPAFLPADTAKISPPATVP